MLRRLSGKFRIPSKLGMEGFMRNFEGFLTHCLRNEEQCGAAARSASGRNEGRR
jgi:hypothetical protein